MKHIKVFEKWNPIDEASTAPVIDFNKLPASVNKSNSDGTTNRNDDEKLWSAGFPKIEDKGDRSGYKSPFTDINFLRYYKDPGGTYYKKEKAPTPNYITIDKYKYDPGFLGKFECITKQDPQKYLPQDTNSDGIIDMFTTSKSQGTVRYYPSGKSKALMAGSNSMGPDAKNAKWIDSTWSCSNGKIIDSFIKNKYKMKPYKGSPFVGGNDPKTSYIPIGTTDRGSDGKYITDLQNKLIELKYLNIPKATGNYGNMTQRAILTAAKTSAEGVGNNATYFGDITKGINKALYDSMINGIKIGKETFKFT
jgi:hypothetical protein